jgi:tetraacyldisaccharide 4'-kinase
MLSVKKKVESIINSRGNIPASPLVSLLHAASAVYGSAQRLRAGCYRRNLLPSQKLPCHVISVGNLTAGGTGKTPMTIYLAARLRKAGVRVAVISRGYKGGAESSGGIVSDGRDLLMNAEQAGDEPFLMASRLRDIPVVVGKNRYEAGLITVEKFQPDVIILDDAFQHLKLKRDIDIVLLDCARPFGNSHLLPRGNLREPTAALSRASACILTRSRGETDQATTAGIARIKSLAPRIPIFISSHEPYMYKVKAGSQRPLNQIDNFLLPDQIEDIKQHRVFGFSGIARNDDFRRTVEKFGCTIGGFSAFSDHHQYRGDDLVKIAEAARQAGSDCLITTEKDHARIAHQKPLSIDLVVVGVRIAFSGDDDHQDFMSFIRSRIAQ